jgi:hypothetical protein
MTQRADRRARGYRHEAFALRAQAFASTAAVPLTEAIRQHHQQAQPTQGGASSDRHAGATASCRSHEDYAFAAPTITQRKLRALQRKAGDTGARISLAGETKRRTLEQRFLQEAERNYQNYVAFKARRNRGAGAASGDTTVEAVKAANDARQAPQSPDACSSRSGSPAPKEILAPSP